MTVSHRLIRLVWYGNVVIDVGLPKRHVKKSATRHSKFDIHRTQQYSLQDGPMSPRYSDSYLSPFPGSGKEETSLE